jgi:RNA-directed DNA polymerase
VAGDFERLTDWDNLLLAYRNAARGKRGRGDVAAFEHRLEDNLIGLKQQLEERTWRPGGYRSFHVHKPKRRLISAAPFRDRVVHHALCNVIEPRFERRFVPESFANRRGKGTHRALAHAQGLARRHGWCLQLDVRQFFPSIDHAILRARLARRVTDARVLALIDAILASGVGVLAEDYRMVHFPGDDLLAVLRPRGLPIGNLTSQFWANVHLDPLDHFIKRTLRCASYVRYVDDLLLFADDRRTLWAWREALTERLAALRLVFHPGAQPRPVTEGIPFLGFVIYPARMPLKRRKVVAYRRHLLALVAHGDAAAVQASLCAWDGHARHGSTTGLRARLRALGGSLPSPARADDGERDLAQGRRDAEIKRSREQ